MDTPLYIGKIALGKIELPIVDCTGWYAVGTGARCRKGLDVAGCPSCPQRTTRNGNLKEPSVYGKGGERTRDPIPVTPPQAPPPKPMRGLGDAISRVTGKLGIKECGGCAKRRALLNKVVPFGKGEA
jgi:hypothetical protein